MKSLLALILSVTALTANASETRDFSSHDECKATAKALEDATRYSRRNLTSDYSLDSKIYPGYNVRVIRANDKVYAFTCMFLWTNNVVIDTEEEYLEKQYKVAKKTLEYSRREDQADKKLLKLLD